MDNTTIQKFLDEHDYDIRKTHNGRWIDQKCTMDVVCLVSDCIVEYTSNREDKRFNDIISSINSEYDMLLEEADIDSIIKGKTQYYEEAVVQAVETMVQNFVTDLLNSIRERGIDTKSTYTVFIGGGAVLLERFLEQADRLGKHTFIRDMKANADGYDLLYRMTQAGV